MEEFLYVLLSGLGVIGVLVGLLMCLIGGFGNSITHHGVEVTDRTKRMKIRLVFLSIGFLTFAFGGGCIYFAL